MVRLRCLRRVAFSFTNVRPVGSKVHMRVIQTLNITSQLHETMPAENVEIAFEIVPEKRNI